MKKRKHFGIKLILAAAVVIFVAANVPEASSSAVTLLRKVIPWKVSEQDVAGQEAVSSNPQRYEEHMGGVQGMEELTETADGETAVEQSPSFGCYVYGTLGEEERKVYDEIYQAIDSHASKVRVDTLDQKVLEHAYRAVMADHGEIFWVSGYVYTRYTMGVQTVGLDFAPEYTMTLEERETFQTQIDAAVQEILAGAAGAAGDYEKAKYVFEYLAQNVDYETGAPDNQNIISVFLNRSTVCQGYANATQYLLTLLGIQSAVVTGTAEGEAHAWNLVRLDGDYYFIDTTWGNSAYNNGTDEETSFVNYNYFAVTTEEIEKTHRADEFPTLPVCTAVEDNYYRREGKYFSEWNPDAIGSVYARAYDAGEGRAAVKFSSPELYAQAKRYLLDEQHILDYCGGLTTLSYIEDTQPKVLILNFS